MSIYIDKEIYNENIYSVCDKYGIPIKNMIIKKYTSSQKAENEYFRLLILKNIKGVSKIYGMYKNKVLMEKIKGEDLFFYLKKNRLPENTVKKITYDLLLIVQQIHKLGIIHNDIKLENIMYNSQTKKITLIDFEKNKSTLLYSSPEHILYNTHNEEDDIWSIGVTIYTLLMQHRPFDDEHHIIKYNYHIMNKNLSSESKNLISSLLIKNYKNRINIKEALNHNWFKDSCNNGIEKIFIKPKLKILRKYDSSYISESIIEINSIEDSIEDSIEEVKIPLRTLENSRKSTYCWCCPLKCLFKNKIRPL